MHLIDTINHLLKKDTFPGQCSSELVLTLLKSTDQNQRELIDNLFIKMMGKTLSSIIKEYHPSLHSELLKADKLKEEAPSRWISFRWHVEDIYSLRPHYTEAQAISILQRVRAEHNAYVGINWYVLESYCNQYDAEVAQGAH